MITKRYFGAGVIGLLLLVAQVPAQTGNESRPVSTDPKTEDWTFSLLASGYLVPHDQSYGSPSFAADHQWLHLEARYNYEDRKTGSLWAGYNLSTGDRLELEATPMLGVVFGNTTGIAPGGEFSLTYRQIELSAQAEYLINTADHSRSYFYTWNELTYSPVKWFHAGLVSERTRAYHTELDVQRGFSFGFSHKKMDFTTYIFNAGWTDPTVVLSLGFKF